MCVIFCRNLQLTVSIKDKAKCKFDNIAIILSLYITKCHCYHDTPNLHNDYKAITPKIRKKEKTRKRNQSGQESRETERKTGFKFLASMPTTYTCV